jgi:hypothetical protein
MECRGLVALFVVAAAASLAAGCASATAACERAPELAVEEGGFRFDGSDVERSFSCAEQAVFPMRLAVAGLESNRFGTFEDARVADFEKALDADRERFSDVLPLGGFLSGGGRCCRDVASLRAAAARTHADAILLYEQRVDVDQCRTPLAILNLTLVGCWIVPSVSFDVALDTRAALVDVRNGVVYATLHDVRTGSDSSPSALVDSSARDLKARLRGEAFAALRESLGEKITRMRERKAEGTR